MLYTPEFKEKLLFVYFRQRVRHKFKQFWGREERIREYYQKHYCENSPDEKHHFVKWNPHLGCVKMVCRFCAEENPDKLFVPSVNAFKGRTFPFKKKDFARAPCDYRCA